MTLRDDIARMEKMDRMKDESGVPRDMWTTGEEDRTALRIMLGAVIEKYGARALADGMAIPEIDAVLESLWDESKSKAGRR